MEANKTFTEKRLFPKEEVVTEKIDLLKFKGSDIKQKKDRHGFVHSIPNASLESYSVDSTNSGKMKAVITMFSKAPEMLEILMKTALRLKSEVEYNEEYNITSSAKERYDEINDLLKQIID